jgi:hypothetical protein
MSCYINPGILGVSLDLGLDLGILQTLTIYLYNTIFISHSYQFSELRKLVFLEFLEVGSLLIIVVLPLFFAIY